MPLINCPDCGYSSVSIHARMCPKCGSDDPGHTARQEKIELGYQLNAEAEMRRKYPERVQWWYAEKGYLEKKEDYDRAIAMSPLERSKAYTEGMYYISCLKSFLPKDKIRRMTTEIQLNYGN